MLSLDKRRNQTLRLQTAQVNACGGWTDAGHHSQFGAGSRMAVQQTKEHAGARGFADGRCDSGYGGIGRAVDMHALMIDEVFLRDKWHTARYGSGRPWVG